MASTYVQTSGKHETTSASFTAIPGLELTLPRGVKTEAIIILNVPYAYLNPVGSAASIGALFGIAVDGKDLPMIAGFTYKKTDPQRRMPTTLVVGVALTNKAQKIQGRWAGVRGATVVIDTPASLCYFVD